MFFLCSHWGMNRLDKNAIADALLSAPGWAKLGLTEPREHLRIDAAMELAGAILDHLSPPASDANAGEQQAMAL